VKSERFILVLWTFLGDTRELVPDSLHGVSSTVFVSWGRTCLLALLPKISPWQILRKGRH
jgi:hypothetical protein